MTDRERTRRSVLRGASVAVGAGALASLAGCTDAVNSIVGGGSDYQSWLPDPGTISDRDHYSFGYADTAVLADNEDELDDGTADNLGFLEGYWDPVDVGWDETSWVLSGSYVVVEADYELEDVIDDLEDDDYDDEDEYEGFRIFEKEGHGIAVGNGMILAMDDVSEDPADEIEELIDVGNGEEDRYAEEEADMSALVDALGGGAFVTGETMDEPDEEMPEAGVFDEMVAKGSTTSIDGDTASETYAVVYDSESDVDLDDLEAWVDENDGSDEEFDDLDDIEYNQNGRVGLISGTIDTDEI